MITHEKTVEVAGTTTTATKSNYQEAQNPNRTAPRYLKHKVIHRADGISYALCGHTRPTVDAFRIIAELGDAWETTPRCPDCMFIREIQIRAVVRQKKAAQITEFILRHFDEKGE